MVPPPAMARCQDHDGEAPHRRRRGAHARALRSAIAVGLVAVLLASAYLGVRLEHHNGDPTWWVRAGEEFTVAGELPEGFYREEGLGYDGQFYYRLAREPVSTDDRVDGISFDRPAYRHQRLGYPVIAWVLAAGGSVALVPWSLPAANLLAVGVLSVSIALLAMDAGRSRWNGLVVALLPGVVTALTFDLAEAAEAAAIALALLLLRRQQHLAATAVLCYAAITRETALLVPLAILVSHVLARSGRLRSWRLASREGPPLWVAAAPIGVYIATQSLMDRWWGTRGGGVGRTAEQLRPPLTALLRELGGFAGANTDLVHLLALALILVCGALGLHALSERDAGLPHERVAILGATALVAMLGSWDRAIVYLRYPTLWLLIGYVLLLSTRPTPSGARSLRVAAVGIALLGAIAALKLGSFPSPSFEAR